MEETNQRQRRALVTKAEKHFGALAGRRFAVWGLAFKPKTDDLREAPALELITQLLKAGARVRVHDPVAMPAARRLLGDTVEYAETPYDALPQADALFLVTEWNEFRHPDFARMKSLLAQPVVFDGRNVFDPVQMRALGFTYQGMGRR